MSKNKIIKIICVFFCLFSLTAFGENLWTNLSKYIGNRELLADDYSLAVHFLDVGCADCILIEYDDYVFMIDTASVNMYEDIDLYLQKRNIDKIDIMFLSHGDSDHVGSAFKIIENYDVKAVYTNNMSSESEAYTLMLEAVENIDFVRLKENTSLYYDELTFDITAFDDESLSSNNSSLIIKLTYMDLDILFTGDAETVSEEILIESCADIQSDILKVGHHGSASSSSVNFLNYVNPILAIISTGDNLYSLPSKTVLENLEDLEIDYLRTDYSGNIMILTNNGTNLIISTKDEKYEILNN